VDPTELGVRVDEERSGSIENYEGPFRARECEESSSKSIETQRRTDAKGLTNKSVFRMFAPHGDDAPFYRLLISCLKIMSRNRCE
jgi:hypothetical protein